MKTQLVRARGEGGAISFPFICKHRHSRRCILTHLHGLKPMWMSIYLSQSQYLDSKTVIKSFDKDEYLCNAIDMDWKGTMINVDETRTERGREFPPPSLLERVLGGGNRWSHHFAAVGI